jgi:hypothetical protein
MDRYCRWIPLLAFFSVSAVPADVHVWEKQELTFTSAQSFASPYTDVTVWVDLSGPGFQKRICGFWDGGQTFRVRLLAPAPGDWKWHSGSNPPDSGLDGKRGEFHAVAWTESEKQENPLRRGFVKATANQHAVELADGTPFFIIGDTWYLAATSRFRWYDDDQQRPLGPEAGFKDYLRYRKSEGFNAVAIIAVFPAWATDGSPVDIFLNDADHTCVRSAWTEYGTKSAKNMENEGGRPLRAKVRVEIVRGQKRGHRHRPAAADGPPVLNSAPTPLQPARIRIYRRESDDQLPPVPALWETAT